MFTRRTTALTAMAGGALLLISTLITWVTVTGLGETSAAADLDVTGAEAADAVTAMGLVALAGGLAVTIARKIARWIIGGVLIAAGLAALVAVLAAFLDPAAAASGAVGEVTGTTEAAASYDLGFGPWLGLIGGIIVVGAASVLLTVSHRWTDRGTKKYSRTVVDDGGEVDEYDLWDGLTEGDDLTDRA